MSDKKAEKAEKAQNPEVQKYKLLHGSHSLFDEKTGERNALHAGDEALLTAAYVSHFPDKFALVVIPDPSTVVATIERVGAPAAPAAPTIKELEAAIAALPAIPGVDDDDEFEDADEALAVMRSIYGDLLHDDYAAQIVKAFEKQEEVAPAPAEAAAPAPTKK